MKNSLLEFFKLFKKTYNEEYERLLKERGFDLKRREHLHKMNTDREYNDAYILRVVKESIKDWE